jgi:hypothetical protein
MLAAIAFIAALADYTGGTAIITIIPQAMSVKMYHIFQRNQTYALTENGR